MLRRSDWFEFSQDSHRITARSSSGGENMHGQSYRIYHQRSAIGRGYVEHRSSICRNLYWDSGAFVVTNREHDVALLIVGVENDRLARLER